MGGAPTGRPGRILNPRRGQGRHRKDGCEACAQCQSREGALPKKEGRALQQDEAAVGEATLVFSSAVTDRRSFRLTRTTGEVHLA